MECVCYIGYITICCTKFSWNQFNFGGEIYRHVEITVALCPTKRTSCKKHINIFGHSNKLKLYTLRAILWASGLFCFMLQIHSHLLLFFMSHCHDSQCVLLYLLEICITQSVFRASFLPGESPPPPCRIQQQWIVVQQVLVDYNDCLTRRSIIHVACCLYECTL